MLYEIRTYIYNAFLRENNPKGRKKEDFSLPTKETFSFANFKIGDAFRNVVSKAHINKSKEKRPETTIKYTIKTLPDLDGKGQGRVT